MESYIEKKARDGQKPGNGRATFRDLVEKYGDRHFKRLYVFGTNLTQPASPINSLRSFTGGVIDALLDIQDILLKTNPGDERRSGFINDLGVKFTDFELSDQMKRALIDQGRIAITEYLDKPQQPLSEIKRLLRRA
jgi:hypothetical protein